MEFKKIFDTFYKGLFLFAQKYIAECDVVEDIVQEIFIKLWEKRDTIENTSAVKAFLYIGVKNKALNYFRHQKIVQKYQKEMIQLKSQESFFKNHLIEEETYRLLLQSIKQLPEQTRKVCILSMNGVKNAQIAEQLDISTSTVKYHKKQAITILQGKLKDHLYLIPIIIRLMGL
ncbi:MAG: RNA polymerase sigma-70 factor [Marinifilum sp.]|nr:RNA polymerase sigma-70 factor [Marinifilum sp.]